MPYKFRIHYNDKELTATIKHGRSTVAKVYAGNKTPTMERVRVNAEAMLNGLRDARKKLLDELEDVETQLSRLPAPDDSEQAKLLTERYINIKMYLNGF